VLVYRSPIGEFKPTKGLIQGDPLAPFLFLIVAEEGLSRIVRQVVDKNLLKGIKVRKKEVDVDILQFADDTLFFCQAETQNILTIKSILRFFELVSGLKVKFHKSKVGGIGVENLMIDRFSILLYCSKMGIPFIYLGMLVGGSHRKRDFWNSIADKIRKKLAKWRGKVLSIVGRVVLIKSVITPLPLSYLSLFRMLVNVIKEVKIIERDFLWGWGQDRKKIAWVK